MSQKLLFAVLCFCLLACQDEEILHSPALQTPVVTGIQFTNTQGSPLYRWGVPNQKQQESTTSCGNVRIIAYPNPATDRFALRFYHANCPAKADIWITPARLANSLNKEQFSFANATLARPGGFAIKTLAKQEMVSPDMTWDGTDDLGREVPTGFYRVYFRIEKTLLWTDLLLIRRLEEVPLSIRKIILPFND